MVNSGLKGVRNIRHGLEKCKKEGEILELVRDGVRWVTRQAYELKSMDPISRTYKYGIEQEWHGR